jgi:DUF971 family protein
MPVNIVNLQVIGQELALKWSDGSESYVDLVQLRRACPCAGCRGEVDVMGNLHRGPEIPLTTESFRLLRVVPVGGYAIQPFWADGHSSGLFSFDYVRALVQGEAPESGTSKH